MLNYGIFENYARIMRDMPSYIVNNLPEALLLDKDNDISIYYAPFDWVNETARVVLVGITPGMQQAANALNAARDALCNGKGIEETAKTAKNTASFSGSMRSALVEMLDYVGLHKKLGIGSCGGVFDEHRHLVHYTSALRYPVFVNDKNYSGTPEMTSHPLLKKYLLDYFAKDVDLLPEAIYIPLGPKVAKAMLYLAKQGILNEKYILSGLPHPSGANAERIAYFLGRKNRDALSVKTNPILLDAAKASLFEKMNHL